MNTSLGGIILAQIVPLDDVDGLLTVNQKIGIDLKTGRSWLSLPLYSQQSTLTDDADITQNGIDIKDEVSLKLLPHDKVLIERISSIAKSCLFYLKLQFSDGSIMILGDETYPCTGYVTFDPGTLPKNPQAYVLHIKSSSRLRYLTDF